MKNRLFEGISFLLILVAIYILNHQLTTIADVHMGDEAFYLYQGISNFRLGLQTDWGPAYSLWYKFLSFFQPDTIRLYYLNMFLMSSLSTIVLYVALRVAQFRWYWALYCTLAFHFSPINFPEGVKVSILLFLLTLLVFIMSARYLRQRLHLACALLTLTYSVFAYFRPEYVVPFGVCFVLFIGATFWFRQSFYLVAGIAAVVLLLFFGVGSPLSEKGEKAFKQDFSYNYTMRHPEDARLHEYNNWVDSEVMSQLIFGERVSGLSNALIRHPKLVLGDHLLPNMYNLSVQLISILGTYFTPLTYLRGVSALEPLLYRKLTWLLLMAGFLAAVSIRKTARVAAQRVLDNPWPYIVAITAVIAPVASSIYSMGIKIRYLPPFYFFIPVVVGALLVSIQLRPWLSQRIPAPKPVSPLVRAVLTLLFVLGVGGWMFQESQQQTPTRAIDRKLIEYTRQLTASVTDRDRIRMFENPDALTTYLGGVAIAYERYKRNSDFHEFVKQNDINLIIFRPEIMHYYRNDTSMQRFIEHPPQAFIRKLGFYPNTYTLVRQDLLK
ncbi:hypothetical protein [Spirosoma fluviale]|uniref:Glycosyltransferase RgtA/B/C/D-like domain-containing protein n=1 Tax=Spirosoma fluviale TaxID=1597977 RepID=A0A286GIP1_9BACT|nr:hypothetical protein [Spirosoma fluviale]SOD95370.1 hypothetical protein SAMN06269250_4836 [Spirosoma fluviale]